MIIVHNSFYSNVQLKKKRFIINFELKTELATSVYFSNEKDDITGALWTTKIVWNGTNTFTDDQSFIIYDAINTKLINNFYAKPISIS